MDATRSVTDSITGFLIVYAKFSDILGRKLLILVAIGLFTVFSIVCGSIANMTQLWVCLFRLAVSCLFAEICSVTFRSLQGVGAPGIYAVVTVIQPELVPPENGVITSQSSLWLLSYLLFLALYWEVQLMTTRPGVGSFY
ncbi:hypothetical protein F4818DRAFT_51473 [Hypoxylon cercidicola]|nr:hypothetical protein F4818DRAFT_51473 [Hypoxylon cercidicola]